MDSKTFFKNKLLTLADNIANHTNLTPELVDVLIKKIKLLIEYKDEFRELICTRSLYDSLVKKSKYLKDEIIYDVFNINDDFKTNIIATKFQLDFLRGLLMELENINKGA